MTTPNRILSGVALGIGLALTMSSPVIAQTQPTSSLGSSYMSVFAGGAHTSSESGPVTGASLGIELTKRMNLEGRVRWFDVAAGDNAFAADLGVRYTVVRTTFTAPYVSAGAGVFDSYLSHVSDTTPSFYRQRMDAPDVAHNFHDMLWTFGGGADLFMTGHVALRPEISVFIASTQHDARVVPVYGISLAYFFDSQTSSSRQR
jgi:hypothetical protein